MDNYYERSTQGRSACGWWIPYREMPILSRPGAVAVSLGTVHDDKSMDLWVHNLLAVVDDFGTLRRVPE